jgi:F0F1-type ATP synthase assembly protein I
MMISTQKIAAIDERGEIKITAKKVRKKSEYMVLEYLNLGYYLIIPMLAGIFLGLVLDSWFKTRPIFVLSFLLLGTLGSFYNLFKLLKNG